MIEFVLDAASKFERRLDDEVEAEATAAGKTGGADETDDVICELFRDTAEFGILLMNGLRR